MGHKETSIKDISDPSFVFIDFAAQKYTS